MWNLEWWNQAEPALWQQRVIQGDTLGDAVNEKFGTHGLRVSHAVSGMN